MVSLVFPVGSRALHLSQSVHAHVYFLACVSLPGLVGGDMQLLPLFKRVDRVMRLEMRLPPALGFFSPETSFSLHFASPPEAVVMAVHCCGENPRCLRSTAPS